jgi:glutaminase
MAQVIQEQGLASVEKQIGVDATGARFNSIIAVEGCGRWSAPEPRK